MDNLKTIYQKWDVEIKVKSNCRTTNTIEADSTQINEIFSNILENAYQSFPGKKGTIEIDMDCNSQENKIIIIFRDNGIGIDEKDLPKITDPFFTTKARGIGLGLTVCKQIVSLHKGELEFQSVKGKGTTVVISLPIRRKL
ncbi:GHKL domain-containing protein [Candidatus Desantisbacteria bacterium]|nr:GHKL domain-containing protein [Candidatus Desantisbacteria bacterium]